MSLLNYLIMSLPQLRREMSVDNRQSEIYVKTHEHARKIDGQIERKMEKKMDRWIYSIDGEMNRQKDRWTDR